MGILTNRVLWQQELYLHPIPSGDRSGLVFVFGKDDIDLNTAPRDTSLRRALLDHWQAKAGHYQKGPGHPGGIRPYGFHGELLRGPTIQLWWWRPGAAILRLRMARPGSPRRGCCGR